MQLDFSILNPGKSYNLLKKWSDFRKLILSVFNEKVKDKQNINLLKLLNTESAESRF